MFTQKAAIITLFFLLLLTTRFLIVCSSGTGKGLKTAEKQVELGHYLFFDRRLSVNNTRSCGTCHNPEFAFTDGYKRSLGAYADLHQRNTQPVFNLLFLKYLTSSDSSLHFAQQQMQNPLFNQHPVEMGMTGNEKKILLKIIDDKRYQSLFAEAFPGQQNPISVTNIITSISQFIYTIRSERSSYDRFISGDSNALTAGQRRGKQLFFSSQLQCATCHGGFNFSTPSLLTAAGDTQYYFNTGLYNVGNRNTYPEYDKGLYQHTKQIKDNGAFRVPTIRNLAFTAPYFHDGSAATLDEVIRIYESGGRVLLQGEYKGDGRKNIFKHSLITGFSLNSQERKELISFLLSLSDSSVITNPAYANPFNEDETRQ
jgi:cytochrome c peroxidase